MKIYKVSCHSSCGSYFASYLQSVTVVADNKIEAINKVKDYNLHTGEGFIRPITTDDVEELKQNSFGIIDYLHDSDY